MKKKICLGFLLTFFPFVNANAILIQGKFEAVVERVSDLADSGEENLRFWRGLNVGDIVRGSYWYDTKLAPPPTSIVDNVWLNYASYGKNIPVWSGMNSTIDGHIFDVTKDQPAGLELVRRSRTVDVRDGAFGRVKEDGFSIHNEIVWIDSLGNYSHTYLSIGFRHEDNILHGLSLGQEFIWRGDASENNGLGVIQKEGTINGQRYRGGVVLNPVFMSARAVEKINVPEPKIAFLLLIALLAIRVSRTRRNL